MKKYILSAASVSSGTWDYRKISDSEAYDWVRECSSWKSNIVYPATAAALGLIVDYPIPCQKMVTHFEPGDEALVIRLLSATRGVPTLPTVKDVMKNYELGVLKRVK